MIEAFDMADGRERFFFPLAGAALEQARLPCLGGQLMRFDRESWAELERSDVADRMAGRVRSAPIFLVFTSDAPDPDWQTSLRRHERLAQALVDSMRLELGVEVVSPRFLGLYRRCGGVRSRHPGFYRVHQPAPTREPQPIGPAQLPRLEDLAGKIHALREGAAFEIVLDCFDRAHAPFLDDNSKLRLLCTALEGLLGPPGSAKFKRRLVRLDALRDESLPPSISTGRVSTLRNAVAHHGELPDDVAPRDAFDALRLLVRRALLVVLDDAHGSRRALRDALDG